MRRGLVIGGLALTLASAHFAALFLAVGASPAYWAAGIAALGVGLALTGLVTGPRAASGAWRGTSRLGLVVTGLTLAVAGAVWEADLLLYIRDNYLHPTGSSGGLINGAVVQVLFVVIPVTVVGAVVAMIGLFPRPRVEALRLSAQP